MSNPKATRVEHDSLGNVEVPADAYYGPETARAIANFPISGIRPLPEFIRATVLVKKAAIEAHASLGLLDRRIADAVVSAVDEILQGKLLDQFILDVFQAGAGTSHNMNANEVLANRAIELLGGHKGDYKLVSPHDHVNIGQSTNDTYPTITRVAVMLLSTPMMEAVSSLKAAFEQKAKEFDRVVKSGRTHLQDASAIRLGQEFAAWGHILGDDLSTLQNSLDKILELNLGGTAVGTGLNADPRYVKLAVENLGKYTGFKFRVGENLAALMQSMADFVELSGCAANLERRPHQDRK